MRVELQRSEARLLIVGGLSAGAALALCLIDPAAALTGWLGAAVAFAAIPAGALCLMAMMRLIPGAWGESLRLTCEAGTLLALPAPLLLLLLLVLTLALLLVLLLTEKLVGWLSGWLTGRPASRPAGRPADWLSGWLAGWPAGPLAGGQLAGRLAGWSAGRLAVWPAGQPAGWLAG